MQGSSSGAIYSEQDDSEQEKGIAMIAQRLSRLVLCAGVGVAILAHSSQAATKTWDGGGPDNNWSSANNWSTDVAPVPGADALVFTGGARLSNTNNFAAGSVFGGISFDAGAGAFALAGNQIVLPTGGPANSADIVNDVGMTAGGGIVNLSANAQTVNTPVRLKDGKHVFQTDAANLNIGGAITRDVGALLVFDPASGTNINLTGSGLTRDGSDGGGILGGWAALGGNEPNGPDSNVTGDYATLDASGNVVPYAGYTDIAAGAITSSATANLRFTGDTGNLTAADGTELNTILLQNATSGRNVTITGTMKLGAANPGGRSGGIYKTPVGPAVGNGTTFAVNGGTLTVKGGGELSLLDSTNHATWSGFAAQNNNLTIGSVVADDGANPVHVNIMGYAVLNGANTYTGNTTIAQGRVQAGNAAGQSFGAPGSTVTVYAGGQVFRNANATFNYNWILNGVGSQESDGLGAVRAGAGRIMGGTITLQSSAAFGANNSNAANSLTVTANITGPGGIMIGHGNNANGSGTVRFGNGTGTQHYDYQGDTIVNMSRLGAQNTFFITTGSHNLLPHGAGRGNMILRGTGVTTANLNLNGTSQTVNALNSDGDTPSNANITGGPGAVLAMGDNNASGSYAGAISTEISLRKIGSGTQSLTGAVSNTGNLQVFGGTIRIENPVIGTFLSGDGITRSNLAISNGGKLDLPNAGTIQVNALYFGAAAQAFGTWGATGSGATHIDNTRFLGLGVIEVMNPTLVNLLPGDFNGDKIVNELDLAKWKLEAGYGGGADADYDGDSDGNDLLIWQRNLGQSIPGVAVAATVPEPGVMVLAAMALVAGAAARRRR
jgi:autotransporter-associated beta strand protein